MRVDGRRSSRPIIATLAKSARGGEVKIARSRMPTLPDVPSLAESGLSDFELAVWYGLLVPKGTPRPVVEQLAAALKAASSDAGYLKRMAEFGVQPVPAERAGPDGFASYFRAEATRWAPVIKAAGAFAD